MAMQYSCLSEVADCLGLTAQKKTIKGFAFDSRLVQEGHLFFALKGERSDGHDFLKDVAAEGGVGAVVDRAYAGETCGLILLRVDDVTAALQKLAQEIQKKRKQRIVAVTGSVGKTTTKEFLATLLAQKYTVAKTPGNSNSQVGLPLALLNDPGISEFFVVEMGMEQAGEISKLVNMAPPELAVITKITHQHQRHFPEGIEGIAAAKAEILQHPNTKLGVVNVRAMQYSSIRNNGLCRKVTFGIEPDQADFVLRPGWIIQQDEESSSTIRLPFSELHLCEDFIAAAAAARLLGLDGSHLIAGAQGLKSIKLRFEKVEKNGILFINDCYNAEPESMQAAVNHIPQPSFGGKTIAVLGEMTELGSYTDEGHRVVAHAAISKVDHLLCYGKGCWPMVEIFNQAGKPVDLFRDMKALKQTLFEISKTGDVVLIKGSNGNKLWQLLEEPFPL